MEGLHEDVSIEIAGRVGAHIDEPDAATADATTADATTADATTTATTTTTTTTTTTDADATAARCTISHERHSSSATTDAWSNANGW